MGQICSSSRRIAGLPARQAIRGIYYFQTFLIHRMRSDGIKSVPWRNESEYPAARYLSYMCSQIHPAQLYGGLQHAQKQIAQGRAEIIGKYDLEIGEHLGFFLGSS